MFSIDKIVRKNIRNLQPYSTARDEFKGNAETFLDANENSLGSPLKKWYNRYPDPYQKKLKEAIHFIKKVCVESIFLGNGSDECIDILFRCFVEPKIDNCIICPPTYGMYQVSAAINAVQIKYVPLLPDFQLDMDGLAAAIDEHTKIIWLCSPNNPTGNCLNRADMLLLLNNFEGLVVVDEAYINFAKQKSFLTDLLEYPNLLVLQTLSKAWGLAGLRIGMAFGNPELIHFMNKVKPPYNLSQIVQEMALEALQEVGQVNDMIREIVDMREALKTVLEKIGIVEKVYPSDANFLLVKIQNAKTVYEFLLSKAIVVRDRSNVSLCENCLRITIGTEKENTLLIDALLEYETTLR